MSEAEEPHHTLRYLTLGGNFEAQSRRLLSNYNIFIVRALYVTATIRDAGFSPTRQLMRYIKESVIQR